MTEIQWLVDIMLNNKLSEPVKQKFIARIGEVESQLSKAPPTYPTRGAPVQAYQVPIAGLSSPTGQSPSTQRILDQMAAEGNPLPAPEQPAVIAQSAAAAQALVQRAQAISIAVSGKEEKGRTSPRKF